jgi:hypothetical protein
VQSGQEGLFASIARAHRRIEKAQRGVTKKATRSPSRVARRVELRRPLRA